MNVEPGEWFPDLKLSRICLPVSAALHLRSWGGWWWRKGKKRTVSLGSSMGWGTGHSIQKQHLCMRHGEKPRQNASKSTVYLGVWQNCKNTNQALVMEVYDIIVSAWNLPEYCPICFNERLNQFAILNKTCFHSVLLWCTGRHKGEKKSKKMDHHSERHEALLLWVSSNEQ